MCREHNHLEYFCLCFSCIGIYALEASFTPPSAKGDGRHYVHLSRDESVQLRPDGLSFSSSSSVPAQRRPWGSHLPSLKRFVGLWGSTVCRTASAFTACRSGSETAHLTTAKERPRPTRNRSRSPSTGITRDTLAPDSSASVEWVMHYVASV